MTDEQTIQTLSQSLVTQLTVAGRQLATAESCTGGWIAKSVTDIPGSSACFAWGVVSYSNGAKERLLGVQAKTLETYGAVSEAVVREMAEGAIRLSGADLSVAVSGIAGPDGGSEAKPVGTVWFAFSQRLSQGIETTADQRVFDGDRDAVRRQSVAHALERLSEQAS